MPLPSQLGKSQADAESHEQDETSQSEEFDSSLIGDIKESEQPSQEDTSFDLSPIDAGEGIVRDATQLRRMLDDDNKKVHEFEIDVQLTFYDPTSAKVRFLHQENDFEAQFYGIFCGHQEAPPQLGALMRVRGHAGSKKAGHVIVDSWKQIGAATMPSALLLPSSAGAAKDGSFLGKYCEMRGVLTEILIERNFHQLVIRNEGGLHLWCIRKKTEGPKSYIASVGKHVSVTGVMIGVMNERGERVGFKVHAMEPRQFRFVVGDKPDQDFQLIEGTVIAKDMHNWLGITDGQVVHWVYSNVLDDVPLYSHVTVMCDPNRLGVDGGTALSKVMTITGKDEERNTEAISALDLVDLQLASQPVAIAGTVQSVIRSPDAYEVRLMSQGVLFIARIDRPSDSNLRELLSEGNIVQLTGVQRLFSPSHKGPAAFKLIVNDPLTVHLISKPVHLYAKQIGMIGLAIMSLLGAFLAWNHTLRSKVRSKTKSIREIANRLQASCDATFEGMMFFDRKDRLAEVTGCALELLNIATPTDFPADSAGQTIAMRTKNPSAFLEHWQNAFTDRGSEVREEYSLAVDSKVFALHSVPINDAEGKYDGRICTLRDVTEQRMLEVEISQSQKQIAVGRLAGGIAHDFNNLLMAISANLTLAQQFSDGNAKVEHHTKISQDAVTRASQLTRQLLDFSRRGELTTVVAHINDCVTKVGALAEHMLGDDVELCLKMASDLALTKIDSTQIELVLLNLCINARDSIEGPGGHICVTTSNQVRSDLGPCIQISVDDNGRGMDDKTAAMAFEPFFTTKEVGQGTGLGLAIAYGIVKQHGGIIQCKSELGSGTRFEIYLPQTTERLAKSSFSSKYKLGRIGVKTETMRVLLVDDEPMIRDAGSALLTALGHESVCAPDGQTALNLLDQDSDFDVVLLDLTMPIMSGAEALKQIKSRFPQLRVVICSGYSVDIESLGDDPATAPEAVLSKPFSIDDIRRVLEAPNTQKA